MAVSLTSCNYILPFFGNSSKDNQQKQITTVYKDKQYTYPELLELISKYEFKHKTDFVVVQSSYRKQLFSSKLVYIFNVTNNAKVAVFKDAKFLVSVIAETGTVIRKDTITIYKFFPPNQTIDYKFVTTDVYKDRVIADIKYLGISDSIEKKN